VLTEEGIGEEGGHDELIAADGLYATLHKVQASI
jgi:ATP-binding cassette subfamily B protein